MDFLLDDNLDLALDSKGGVTLTDSLKQEAKIRLKWFLNTWRYGTNLGFIDFYDLYRKNPDMSYIAQCIEDAVEDIDDTVSCTVNEMFLEKETRKLSVSINISRNGENIEEEMTIGG